MSGKACVVGSINYDIIINQSRFAEIGETFTADSIWSGNGGKGANQAVQLAKMGVYTHLVAALGDDIFGELILQELKLYRVNLDGITKFPCSSGLGIVTCTNTGAVKASIVPGANRLLSEKSVECHQEVIRESDILLYQLEIPLETISYSVRFHHDSAFAILNAAPFQKIPDDILKEIDCLVFNETEASQYYGVKISTEDRAIKVLRNSEQLKRDVIITLGSLGVVAASTDRKVEFFPALPVEAHETTGAGDSFIGAFAADFLENQDFFSAVEYGNRAASITVQTIGGQCSMPTKAQLLQSETNGSKS